jgi:hypothetical protein
LAATRIAFALDMKDLSLLPAHNLLSNAVYA